MFATALAQLRFAASVGFGRPFARWSLERLIDAIDDTKREFGAIGAEGAGLMGGPTLDEETRREVHLRRFRTQATRAARETAYYGRLFERLGLDPARLRFEDIAALIPSTSKEALREDPDAFVHRSASPCFCTTTTGTTGKPTSVCFSAYEMRTYIALGAISHLLTGNIDSADIVQISTSSRATLGNTCFAGACARIGALVFLAGLIEPAHALSLLAQKHHIPAKKPQVSYLNTYPSYLGELVEGGLRRGYRPLDFGLERIGVGGEIVSEGLKARARRLFGSVEFDEGYGMTETWPLQGQPCSEGHLHFEPLSGLVEVIDPETKTSAPPGEVGSIVATPLPPYRDTTIVLRYDTQDVVRPIAGPLTCDLPNQQATTPLLGKLSLAVRHEDGWTFPRDVLEPLEADDNVPLPARYGYWALPGGVGVEVVARETGPSARRAIEACLEKRGLPVRELRVVRDRSQLHHPMPLRCDLKETSFGGPGEATGALRLAPMGPAGQGN